jgi:hypothetical protein
MSRDALWHLTQVGLVCVAKSFWVNLGPDMQFGETDFGFSQVLLFKVKHRFVVDVPAAGHSGCRSAPYYVYMHCGVHLVLSRRFISPASCCWAWVR